MDDLVQCQRMAHEVVRGVARRVELAAEGAARHSPVTAALGVNQVVNLVAGLVVAGPGEVGSSKA
eukprot:5453123-Lingulodinium_polyedra.AAC.1